MKTIDRIPISKVQRASKLLQTGAKVGINYLKYYGDKLVTPQTEAKDRLDKNNAEDIYSSLSKLKGNLGKRRGWGAKNNTSKNSRYQITHGIRCNFGVGYLHRHIPQN